MVNSLNFQIMSRQMLEYRMIKCEKMIESLKHTTPIIHIFNRDYETIITIGTELTSEHDMSEVGREMIRLLISKYENELEHLLKIYRE